MEVKIQIPDNCELIRVGNTYIVKERKGKPKSWEEFCNTTPIKAGEVLINCNNSATSNPFIKAKYSIGHERAGKYWCTSEEEAKAFLALIQLRQLRKEWVGDSVISYPYNSIVNSKFSGVVVKETSFSHPLTFPNKEMAEEFFDYFKDLCETAKILL